MEIYSQTLHSSDELVAPVDPLLISTLTVKLEAGFGTPLGSIQVVGPLF